MPSIDGHTRLVGLLGYPLEHTRSPLMHNAAFAALGLNYCYLPLLVAPEELGTAIGGLAALGFVGVNVTIPHKQAVIAHLDDLSDEARAIGAVNTIIFTEGKRTGYNTDGVGFLRALTDRGLSVAGGHALVLGAGGAARAVVYTLLRAGAAVTILNRTEERARVLADDVRSYASPGMVGFRLHGGPLSVESVAELARSVDLVVNATAVGMWPHVDETPWPREVPFPRQAVAYDLIYASPACPAVTAFLRAAQAAGARTLDGLQMLVYQGAEAFEMWTGRAAPVDVMLTALSGSQALGCTKEEFNDVAIPDGR